VFYGASIVFEQRRLLCQSFYFILNCDVLWCQCYFCFQRGVLCAIEFYSSGVLCASVFLSSGALQQRHFMCQCIFEQRSFAAAAFYVPVYF
jgi:hypothetical protein